MWSLKKRRVPCKGLEREATGDRPGALTAMTIHEPLLSVTCTIRESSSSFLPLSPFLGNALVGKPTNLRKDVVLRACPPQLCWRIRDVMISQPVYNGNTTTIYDKQAKTLPGLIITVQQACSRQLFRYDTSCLSLRL